MPDNTNLATTLSNKADKNNPPFTGTLTVPNIALGSTDLQDKLDDKQKKFTLGFILSTNAVRLFDNNEAKF